MPKFRVYATLTLSAEKVIEADDQDDADERADSINGDEWMDYIMGEDIEIDDVMEEKPAKKKKAKKP